MAVLLAEQIMALLETTLYSALLHLTAVVVEQVAVPVVVLPV
jgi:hypothetical protein